MAYNKIADTRYPNLYSLQAGSVSKVSLCLIKISQS